MMSEMINKRHIINKKIINKRIKQQHKNGNNKYVFVCFGKNRFWMHGENKVRLQRIRNRNKLQLKCRKKEIKRKKKKSRQDLKWDIKKREGGF